MTIFDLAFIVCFLAAAFALVLAAIAAVRGDYTKTLARLRTLGIGLAVYMAILLGTGIDVPHRVYRVGETRCFDDWCIAVENFTRINQSIEVGLRLSSRAKRTPQGETGTVVYLVDAQGHRYDPVSNSVTIPFDTPLQPGESVLAARRFIVPDRVHALSLVYAHEGGFPIGDFIIGQNTWFHGPPVVELK